MSRTKDGILLFQSELSSRPDDTESIASLLGIFPNTKVEDLKFWLDTSGGNIETASMFILENQTQPSTTNVEYNQATSQVRGLSYFVSKLHLPLP